jgi:hypothetical protein
LPDGRAVFSLRPENLRIASGSSQDGVVSFRGQVKRQAFYGATELLQVECTDGLTLSLRTASRQDWRRELRLEFSPADAVPVRESAEVKEKI